MLLLAIFISLVFVYSTISARVERTVVTAPIVFTAVGAIAFILAVEVPNREEGLQVFLRLAEVGLVLLLFTDASRTDLATLKEVYGLPVRLLSAGMLLTIVLGAVIAKLVFPQLSVWEAGILSAILAPTDAGLGQIIVSSPRVPIRIRQALNVEAGLNDGLSVPFLMFFMALAGTQAVSHEANLMRFIIEQLGYGTVVGLTIGLGGGGLLGFAQRNHWVTESFSQLSVVVLPLLCAVVSEAVGASMFIAAFVAGLAVQFGYKDAGRHSVEFTEEWGQLLNLSVFFLFGMIAARNRHQFGVAFVAYAILSLSVVRMLPVAIALIGTKLSRATVLFMGWFGPRGLASIVLGLIYLEQHQHLPGESTIRLAIIATVFLSIFAHGFSAMPGIAAYAARITRLDATSPEYQGVPMKWDAKDIAELAAFDSQSRT